MSADFAAACSLMGSVDRGDIVIREAQLLLTARKREALQHASVPRAQRECERERYPEN